MIFSDDASELQKALNVFQEYWTKWKLTVNVTKTKILIISKGRPRNNLHFYFNNSELEIVSEYKYLGFFLSRSGNFKAAKKHISGQANKALFSLIKKIRTSDLPFDLQIDLFNKTITPILLYGCEIWGYGNCDVIERVQLKFYKHILNLKKSTPSYMIYGELGIMPIIVDIKARIALFGHNLSLQSTVQKLASGIYDIIYHMHKNSICRSSFIENIKYIVETCGFAGFWQSQNVINPKWFSLAFSQNNQIPIYARMVISSSNSFQRNKLRIV